MATNVGASNPKSNQTYTSLPMLQIVPGGLHKRRWWLGMCTLSALRVPDHPGVRQVTTPGR